MITRDKKLLTNNIGRRLWAYSGDSFYMQRLSGAPYQKQNLIRLRDLVPSPRTVVDIGMNVGMNTIEYATFAKAVHGFEPVPETHELAVENIRMNKESYSKDKEWYPNASLELTANIDTYNVALGYEEDTLEMAIMANDGHNRILSEDETTNYPTVSVPVHLLDNYNFADVDIIKVDVEGYELNVLRGAVETIKKNRPIVQVETVLKQPKRYGTELDDLMLFFANLNYVPTTSTGELLCSKKWYFRFKQMDRFFIPAERIDLYDASQQIVLEDVEGIKYGGHSRAAKVRKVIYDNLDKTQEEVIDMCFENEEFDFKDKGLASCYVKGNWGRVQKIFDEDNANDSIS